MSLTSTPSRPIHLPTLLLCVLAASVIWLLNALNKNNYTVNVEYPIVFDYDHSAYVPLSPLPKTVSVSVTGNGWHLLRQQWLPFQSEPIRYRLSNPLRSRTISTASLSAALSEKDKSVKVNYILTDTLNLQFDRNVVREVPVVVDSAGIDLADRMVVASVINVIPRTIRFEGPGRLLKAVPDTLRLKVPGLRITNNYDEEVRVNAPTHPLLRSSADRVRISFEVAELLQP